MILWVIEPIRMAHKSFDDASWFSLLYLFLFDLIIKCRIFSTHDLWKRIVQHQNQTLEGILHNPLKLLVFVLEDLVNPITSFIPYGSWIMVCSTSVSSSLSGCAYFGCSIGFSWWTTTSLSHLKCKENVIEITSQIFSNSIF